MIMIAVVAGTHASSLTRLHVDERRLKRVETDQGKQVWRPQTGTGQTEAETRHTRQHQTEVHKGSRPQPRRSKGQCSRRDKPNPTSWSEAPAPPKRSAQKLRA